MADVPLRCPSPSRSRLVFSVEQLVVYPAQGVGRVERIETQVIGGASAAFFIVRILSNNVTLMVPVKNASNVGLRPLCSAEEGQAILESLKDRSDFTGYTGQNWNRRYREYSEKLKSGALSDVALRAQRAAAHRGKTRNCPSANAGCSSRPPACSPWNWPWPCRGTSRRSRT